MTDALTFVVTVSQPAAPPGQQVLGTVIVTVPGDTDPPAHLAVALATASRIVGGPAPPPPTQPPEPSIGEQVRLLLLRSHAAHGAALDARQRDDSLRADQHTTQAFTWRSEAHAMDPQHTTPAWADEAKNAAPGHDLHAELMQFYSEQLPPPDGTRK